MKRSTAERKKRGADRAGRGSCIFTPLLLAECFSTLSKYATSKKKSDVLLHENIFLEYDSVTHSTSAWPTNYKHNLNDFHCLKTLQKLVFARWKLSLCFWLLFHILPLIFHTQTHQKHFSFFLGRGSQQKTPAGGNLFVRFIFSISISLPRILADWLLKCCFLSRELQNSARARMMEITFLASLRSASIRPGVYFKCNWVWCVHKGKTPCLWPKRYALFHFWICRQTL